jgi:hypothetical protein
MPPRDRLVDRHASLGCDADAPAGSVIDAVARDLGLRAGERAALHRAVGSALDPHPPAASAGPGALDAIWTPAVSVGAGGRILAVNRTARLVLRGIGREVAGEGNHARWLLLDPSARGVFADWESVARETVLTLRDDVRRRPEDVALARLVGRLLISSGSFARWWAEAHRTAAERPPPAASAAQRRLHVYGLRGRRSGAASPRWWPRSTPPADRRGGG